ITGGLAQVSGSLEVRGSVIAEGAAGAAGADGTVNKLIFTLATVTGGDPVDLTPPPDGEGDAENTLIIDYRDADGRVADIEWTATPMGVDDGDKLLEDRELAQITIDMSKVLTGENTLGPNSTFVIELKPPTGGTMPL